MARILKQLELVASSISNDSVAISSINQCISYTVLIVEVQKCAEWLQSIGAQVVALQAGNSIEWVLVDLACQELGLVFIPLPVFFTADQIQQCVSSAGVDTLLSDSNILLDKTDISLESIDNNNTNNSLQLYAWKVSRSHSPNLPNDTQKITFTSGSTGNPKGVCLSFNNQWDVARSLADVIDIKNPKHLCLLPLSTLLENIAGVYTPLLSGGEIIIPSDSDRGLLGSSRLDAKVLLGCITSTKPMSMILVPQLLTLLVQACMNGWQPPASLKFVAVGGGKVSPQLIDKARSFGLPVYQGYGLSECGSVVALNTPSNDHVDSVGHVLAHCQVVVENTEILVSGVVHLGYLGDAASWYPEKIYTGDIGSIKDGFLQINGRSKNVLISSFGRNISPEWVESVLLSAPMFSHCMVFGDEQPYLIVLVSAPSTIDDSDIAQWLKSCNKNLPDYAKIGDWMRVTDEELQPFITANGRPQREKIKHSFSNRINKLYLNQAATIAV